MTSSFTRATKNIRPDDRMRRRLGDKDIMMSSARAMKQQNQPSDTAKGIRGASARARTKSSPLLRRSYGRGWCDTLLPVRYFTHSGNPLREGKLICTTDNSLYYVLRGPLAGKIIVQGMDEK